MPPLSMRELDARRDRRRKASQHQRRRALLFLLVGLAGVGLIALMVGVVGQGSSPPAPHASVASSLDLGLPQNRTLAEADGVALKLPLDRRTITAIAFHAVDDPQALALQPASGLRYHIASNEGAGGPSTAALDVGAPAGSIVRSPVDGTVASVVAIEVAGQRAGYEVNVTSDSADGVYVRITHLDPVRSGAAPAVSIGDALTAGVTPIGRVSDYSRLSDIPQPAIARYTSDGGNHVHIEVVKAGG